MKTFFYGYGSGRFYPDDFNSSLQEVTVCLMIDGEHCARGIAIKAAEDQNDPTQGQAIARRHAYMALGKSRRLTEIKNRSAIKVLIESGCPFTAKGERDPVLTWQEVKMARLSSPHCFRPTKGMQREKRLHHIEARVNDIMRDYPFPHFFPHGVVTGRYSPRQQGKSWVKQLLASVDPAIRDPRRP